MAAGVPNAFDESTASSFDVVPDGQVVTRDARVRENALALGFTIA